MYRNRCFVFCFVFCFVCEITRESEKCNLMEDCTIAISGGRNFVMVLIVISSRRNFNSSIFQGLTVHMKTANSLSYYYFGFITLVHLLHYIISQSHLRIHLESPVVHQDIFVNHKLAYKQASLHLF